MQLRGECAIDTYKLLDEIESLVEEGRHLFGLTMISREEFFELTNKLRASLPEEMRRANKLNQDSERIVVGAKETAEQTVLDARAEAQRVMDSSHQYAEKLVRDTEQKIQSRMQDAEALAQKNVTEARAVAHQLTHEAKLAAEKAVAEATRRADHLVNDSEVMRLALAQAKEIVAAAEADAKDMRRGADEYAREELSRIERVLTDATIIVQRGRTKLEQRAVVQEPPSIQQRGGNQSGDLASSRR